MCIILVNEFKKLTTLNIYVFMFMFMYKDRIL